MTQFMTQLSILLLVAASAFAQKQPITLETLSAGGRGGGRGGAGFAGPPTWMPDGARFVFRQGRRLMRYGPATHARSGLPRGTVPGHRILVVAPFESALASVVLGRQKQGNPGR
jgi:hypothetical protein